jgi:hypothetical protein
VGEGNGVVSFKKWDRWCAIVNAVMNIPIKCGEILDLLRTGQVSQE